MSHNDKPKNLPKNNVILKNAFVSDSLFSCDIIKMLR